VDDRRLRILCPAQRVLGFLSVGPARGGPRLPKLLCRLPIGQNVKSLTVAPVESLAMVGATTKPAPRHRGMHTTACLMALIRTLAAAPTQSSGSPKCGTSDQRANEL
jgi:hypothetical protein